MNRRLFIILIAGILLAGGIAYLAVNPRRDASAPISAQTPASAEAAATGQVREITIRAKKDRWRFEPETVDIRQGDHVMATIINEDSIDHGFAIAAFGVSRRIPAGQTVTIEFDASERGDFQFYCSIPCGKGTVDGHTRGHFDMTGIVHVKGALEAR